MAGLLLPNSFAQQPQGPVSINRSLGINQTITHCLPLGGNPREIVQGGVLSYFTGASRVVDTHGVSLNASGSAAVASIAIDLSSYSKLTVSFWLYWDIFANDDKLLMEYGANFSGNNGFLVNPNSGNPFNGLIQVGVGGSAGFNVQAIARPTGAAWHHYLFALDRGPGTDVQSTVSYIDGVLAPVVSSTGLTNFANPFGNNSLYIFSRNNASLFGAGRMQNLVLRGGYLGGLAEARYEYLNPWRLYAAPSSRIWLRAGFKAAYARGSNSVINAGITR